MSESVVSSLDRYAQTMIINDIQIHSSAECFLLNDSSRTIDLQSIKKGSVGHINAQFNQAVIECKGVIVYASRQVDEDLQAHDEPHTSQPSQPKGLAQYRC